MFRKSIKGLYHDDYCNGGAVISATGAKLILYMPGVNTRYRIKCLDLPDLCGHCRRWRCEMEKPEFPKLFPWREYHTQTTGVIYKLFGRRAPGGHQNWQKAISNVPHTRTSEAFRQYQTSVKTCVSEWCARQETWIAIIRSFCKETFKGQWFDRLRLILFHRRDGSGHSVVPVYSFFLGGW